MEEILGQVSAALKGAWKHRWFGLLIAWIIGIVGAAAILRLPDQYEASARIFVDTQSILKPLMSGLAVQPNVNQQVAMLSRTLITRPNMEKLIRMADLDLGTQTPAQRDGLIDRLVSTLEINGTGRDNLYTLSYRDPIPRKAERVVQSLVSIFVESSLGDSRKDTDAAKKFIEDQIKIYESRLEAAEAKLKDFKLRNIEMQTGAGPDVAGRIAELSTLHSRAKLELLEAERARDSAKLQIANENSRTVDLSSRSLLQESSQSISTPEIDARIDAQKRNLDGLLQRYTEQHPDVLGARRMIEELERQKSKQVAELRKSMSVSSSGMATGGSLATQELARILAATEVQVASLGARVAEYGARYERALAMVKNAPQIEAEFSQLNRDYAINKKNYEDLVGRRESASLSGNLDSAAGLADFRLIDPPRVAPKPVAPNRSLLLLATLVAAAIAGIVAAFGMSQVRPVFHDARTVRAVSGLPLLGVVTLVPSETMKRQEKSDLVRFGLASAALFACFAAGVGFLVISAGVR